MKSWLRSVNASIKPRFINFLKPNSFVKNGVINVGKNIAAM